MVQTNLTTYKTLADFDQEKQLQLSDTLKAEKKACLRRIAELQPWMKFNLRDYMLLFPDLAPYAFILFIFCYFTLFDEQKCPRHSGYPNGLHPYLQPVDKNNNSGILFNNRYDIDERPSPRPGRTSTSFTPYNQPPFIPYPHPQDQSDHQPKTPETSNKPSSGNGGTSGADT